MSSRPQTARTSAAFRRLKRDREAAAAEGHHPQEVYDTSGMPRVVMSRDEGSSEPWCPSYWLSFKLFFMARISAAVWSSISDCDETFNYWEPMHFLLYGKGFQTWEYSPEYGLRSYFYVMLHLVPAWVYDRLLSPHRMYVFYFVRCLLGCACAAAEAYFVRAVRREIGPNVARIALAFLLFSAGMFVSSAALLPSSTSMYLTMLSYGAWFNGSHNLAVLFTAMSAYLSWPFAALIGAPIAVDIVFRRKKIVFFVKWCVISTVVVLVPQVIFDSNIYGKTVIAPLNIITYNIFTSHGPNLYGTEPWYFYLLNGFLNFNVVFVLALVSWPIQMLCHTLIPGTATAQDSAKWYLNTTGMFLWFAVFFLQPHKEERFLFPVYPLIAFSAACAVDAMQKIIFNVFVKRKFRHYLEHTNWISVLLLTVAAAISFSRIAALHVNYAAPINTWMHVSHLPYSDPGRFGFDRTNSSERINVCMGKEWHRFPSSFFLPSDEWEMRFLRSEFRGQLPQPYMRGLPGADAAAAQRDNFNDLNREEPDRYFGNGAEGCHFVVDLETPATTELEPAYAKDEDRWKVVSELDFLDASATPRAWRTFYVPYIGPMNSAYNRYLLLENKKPVKVTEESSSGQGQGTTAQKSKKTKKNIRHL